MADEKPSGVRVVKNAMANRAGQIDAAEEAALAPTPITPVVGAGMPAPGKPITADEAAAKAAKYKADREAFDAETKAMPKPKGVLQRLFGG